MREVFATTKIPTIAKIFRCFEKFLLIYTLSKNLTNKKMIEFLADLKQILAEFDINEQEISNNNNSITIVFHCFNRLRQFFDLEVKKLK